MKAFIVLTLTILSLSTTFAQAETKIKISTPKAKFSMWPDLIAGIVAEHEMNLNESLGEKLECRLVKFRPTFYKEPGLFGKGIYNMTLTGICNKSFSDMALKINYGEDYGSPWSLELTYTLNGKKHKIESEQSDMD